MDLLLLNEFDPRLWQGGKGGHVDSRKKVESSFMRRRRSFFKILFSAQPSLLSRRLFFSAFTWEGLVLAWLASQASEMYNGWDVKYSGKTVRRCRRYFCTASAYTLKTNKNNRTEKGRMRIHEKWLVWNHLLNSWVATILERWRAAMNYGCVFELRYLIMYSKVPKKRTVSNNRTATEKNSDGR